MRCARRLAALALVAGVCGAVAFRVPGARPLPGWVRSRSSGVVPAPIATHLAAQARCVAGTESRCAPRRDLLVRAATAIVGTGLGWGAGPAAALGSTGGTQPGGAAEVLVYVGAGCFWHVQYEMILAEKKLLGRDGSTYTAVAGYAGGTRVGTGGKVCYHNEAAEADYGQLGHTEVVAVRVPRDRVNEFSKSFVKLFNAKGLRNDPQDKGGEYR